MCVYQTTMLWLWSVSWRGVEGEKEVCVWRKRQVGWRTEEETEEYGFVCTWRIWATCV